MFLEIHFNRALRIFDISLQLLEIHNSTYSLLLQHIYMPRIKCIFKLRSVGVIVEHFSVLKYVKSARVCLQNPMFNVQIRKYSVHCTEKYVVITIAFILPYRCKWTNFYDFHFKVLRLKWNQDWIMTGVHWGNYYFRFCFVLWANFAFLDVGYGGPSCLVFGIWFMQMEFQYFIIQLKTGDIVLMVCRKLCQEFINFNRIKK